MATSATEGAAGAAAARQVYDLSLPFNRNMPTYYFYRQVADAPVFTLVSHPAITPVEDGYVTHVSFGTHTGTHVDAPRHFREDGLTIDQIAPDRWLGEGPVIGVRKGPGEVVTAADLEGSGMEVRPGDIVAVNTGWHHNYCGPATDPIKARAYMEEGPGLCAESARWLVAHGVKTVLVDTPALDACIHMPYGDSSLETHKVLFADQIPGVEGLGGDLDLVTGKRCLISCAPVRYEGGEAFPLRVLAMPLA